MIGRRHVVLWLWCALALGLFAANGRAQDYGAQADRPNIEPFLFRRRVVPSQKFSKAQLETWQSAASNHRPGEADESSREAASLSPEDLADVIAGFEWGTEALPGGRDKTDLTRRAVVLHTDIAVTAAAETAQPDQTTVSTSASLHFGAAMELVNFLKQRLPRGRDDPFILTWWQAVAAQLGRLHETVSSPHFMVRALSQFPRDTEILLMAGVQFEFLASPVAQDAQAGWEPAYERKAEELYREVLKKDPTVVEARIRLARVLGQLRRPEQAAAELDKALDDGAPRSLRFFKYLFLGESRTELNRFGPAREAYERALGLYPGAQSAHLGLSRLERRAGNRSGSAAAIERLIELPHDAQAREDPWSDYFTAGPAARAADMLESLRAPLRR